MKLLFFRVKDKNSSFLKRNIEKIFLTTLFISFGILVIVQLSLISPSTRSKIVSGDQLQGRPLGEEEYLYKQGDITLELSDGLINQDLKVLLNGDEAGDFHENTLNLMVKDGDVVEIDGSGLNSEVEVYIVAKSGNISNESANKSIKISSGVKRLTKIEIE